MDKDQILEPLSTAPDPIRQVHIATHGDATRLSLAYEYDGLSRLRQLARTYNAMSGSDDERAISALDAEDAIVAGFFTRSGEASQSRIAAIRRNLADGSSWHIWGCYAGDPDTSFVGFGDPDIDPYLQRFNLGQPVVDGIAVEIAKTLGTTCTAATDGNGTQFWHGTPSRDVVLNTTTTPALKPFWLWNTIGSRWVSYDSTGTALPQPVIFGAPRAPGDLPTPKPPRWFTDLYWS